MSFLSLQSAILMAMASPDHLFKAHSPESVNLYTSQALLSGCTPNATHGCLDDTAYEFAKQFPCGSRGIFAYAQESCCEQGRPFDFTAEYCCTGSGANGLHSYNDGKCDLSCPDNCACYDEVAPFASPVVSQSVTIEVPKAGVGMDALVDTSSPPEGGYLCNGKPAGGDQGCMNGYQYNYSTHTPCGSWLMQFGTYGCCPSASGFLPYPMATLYCCKIEGAPPGQDYQLKPAPCKCHRYGCS